jgi:hypothetical protein
MMCSIGKSWLTKAFGRTQGGTGQFLCLTMLLEIKRTLRYYELSTRSTCGESMLCKYYLCPPSNASRAHPCTYNPLQCGALKVEESYLDNSATQSKDASTTVKQAQCEVSSVHTAVCHSLSDPAQGHLPLHPSLPKLVLACRGEC